MYRHKPLLLILRQIPPLIQQRLPWRLYDPLPPQVLLVPRLLLLLLQPIILILRQSQTTP
jgi:hypothetical protein